jgi:hypothetical protein
MKIVYEIIHEQVFIIIKFVVIPKEVIREYPVPSVDSTTYEIILLSSTTVRQMYCWQIGSKRGFRQTSIAWSTSYESW